MNIIAYPEKIVVMTTIVSTKEVKTIDVYTKDVVKIDVFTIIV